jgi:hypothetical protein
MDDRTDIDADMKLCEQRMSQVKANVDYSRFEDCDHCDHEDKDMADALLACIETVFLSKSPTVKISGTEIPRAAVVSRFLKLNDGHFDHVIMRILKRSGNIKNPSSYALTVLYKIFEEDEIDISNFVNKSRSAAV